MHAAEFRDDLREAFQFPDLFQIDECLQRLALAEIIAELKATNLMAPPEPMVE
jgi:hypothetical protein